MKIFYRFIESEPEKEKIMKKTMLVLIMLVAIFSFGNAEAEAATIEENKMMEQIHVPKIEEIKINEKIDILENLLNELEFLDNHYKIVPVASNVEVTWEDAFWLVYTFNDIVIEHNGFFYEAKEFNMDDIIYCNFTIYNCGDIEYNGYETVAVHVFDNYNVIIKYDRTRPIR